MEDEIAGDRFARRYSILAAIMLGGIMGPIDASIVNVVLPTIAQSFKAGMPTAQGVPTVYLLTIGSLLLFYGRLGDILGYKRVYLTGLAAFIGASCLCGLASSIRWLIAFRAVQGLAAGMMMAVPFAIVTACFPPHERGKALGINAISISAGLAIGPSLGGFLASSLGWRFVFFINVPIGIAGLLWGRRVIPEFKGQRGKIDVFGVPTAFVFLFFLLLFVNRVPGRGLDPAAGLFLGVAALAGASFFWIERHAPQPMLNLNLFRNWTFSFANLSAFLNYMSQYIIVFLTPFYLQKVLLLHPNKVGLTMTAVPLAVMMVAPFSGSLSDRIGTATLASLGAGICTLALVLISRLPASAHPSDLVWRLALFGLGTGIFQSPNNNAAMGSAPKPYLGVASGILATMRNVGMVFGVTIGGAVLYAFAPPPVLQKAVLDGSEAAAFLSGLRHAYLAGAVLTGMAMGTSLLRHRKNSSLSPADLASPKPPAL